MSIHTLDCKPYVNTDVYASPEWAEISIARDATHNDGRAEGDDSSRGYGQASATVGQKTVEISMQVLYKPTDPAFAALKAAYDARSIVDLALMDGDIEVTGTIGKRGDFVITAFNRAESMTDSVKVDITFKGSTANGHVFDDYTAP